MRRNGANLFSDDLTCLEKAKYQTHSASCQFQWRKEFHNSLDRFCCLLWWILNSHCELQNWLLLFTFSSQPQTTVTVVHRIMQWRAVRWRVQHLLDVQFRISCICFHHKHRPTISFQIDARTCPSSVVWETHFLVISVTIERHTNK